MAFEGKGKKRRLPQWMEAVHEQNKKCAKSSTSEGSDKVAKGSERDCNEVDGNINSSMNLETASSSASGNGEIPKHSAAQIISNSMPLLTFDGTIVYSYQDSDCACICQDIQSTLQDTEKPMFVGFDMEWQVTFRPGSTNKTALIQMCTAEDTCYLFHVSPMISFPKPLKDLIMDTRVILLGLNIESDLWKLERDFDIRVKSVIDRGSAVDIGKLANKKLKSSERWNLDGLCRNVLGKRLNKDTDLRCGEWNSVPLGREQKLYAATDAFAGLVLYKHLSDKL